MLQKQRTWHGGPRILKLQILTVRTSAQCPRFMTRHKGKTPLEANDPVGSRVWLTGDARGASSHRRPPWAKRRKGAGAPSQRAEIRGFLSLASIDHPATKVRPSSEPPLVGSIGPGCRATDNCSLASFTHNGANEHRFAMSYHCGATGQRRGPKYSRGVTYRVRNQSIRGPSGAVRQQAFRRPSSTLREASGALVPGGSKRGGGTEDLHRFARSLTSKDAKRYSIGHFYKKVSARPASVQPSVSLGPPGDA